MTSSGGGGIGVKQSGNYVLKSVNDINFTGNGVSVNRTGKDVTVNITAGGGGGISVKGTEGSLQFANSAGNDLEFATDLKYDSNTNSLEVPAILKLTQNSGPGYIEFPDGTTQGTAAYGVMGGTGATGATGPTEDSIGIYLDSTPDDLTTGKKGFKQVPYNCEVLEWYVLAGQTGSIEFDVKSGSFVAYPTTTSIVGGDYPKLTSQFKNSNTGVTAWSGLTGGDIIDFVINSNTGIQSVGLFIKIRRTS